MEPPLIDVSLRARDVSTRRLLEDRAAAREADIAQQLRDIGVALDRKIAWLATQPPPEPPLAATSPAAPLARPHPPPLLPLADAPSPTSLRSPALSATCELPRIDGRSPTGSPAADAVHSVHGGGHRGPWSKSFAHPFIGSGSDLFERGRSDSPATSPTAASCNMLAGRSIRAIIAILLHHAESMQHITHSAAFAEEIARIRAAIVDAEDSRTVQTALHTLTLLALSLEDDDFFPEEEAQSPRGPPSGRSSPAPGSPNTARLTVSVSPAVSPSSAEIHSPINIEGSAERLIRGFATRFFKSNHEQLVSLFHEEIVAMGYDPDGPMSGGNAASEGSRPGTTDSNISFELPSDSDSEDPRTRDLMEVVQTQRRRAGQLLSKYGKEWLSIAIAGEDYASVAPSSDAGALETRRTGSLESTSSKVQRAHQLACQAALTLHAAGGPPLLNVIAGGGPLSPKTPSRWGTAGTPGGPLDAPAPDTAPSDVASDLGPEGGHAPLPLSIPDEVAEDGDVPPTPCSPMSPASRASRPYSIGHLSCRGSLAGSFRIASSPRHQTPAAPPAPPPAAENPKKGRKRPARRPKGKRAPSRAASRKRATLIPPPPNAVPEVASALLAVDGDSACRSEGSHGAASRASVSLELAPWGEATFELASVQGGCHNSHRVWSAPPTPSQPPPPNDAFHAGQDDAPEAELLNLSFASSASVSPVEESPLFAETLEALTAFMPSHLWEADRALLKSVGEELQGIVEDPGRMIQVAALDRSLGAESAKVEVTPLLKLFLHKFYTEQSWHKRISADTGGVMGGGFSINLQAMKARAAARPAGSPPLPLMAPDPTVQNVDHLYVSRIPVPPKLAKRMAEALAPVPEGYQRVAPSYVPGAGGGRPAEHVQRLYSQRLAGSGSFGDSLPRHHPAYRAATNVPVAEYLPTSDSCDSLVPVGSPSMQSPAHRAAVGIAVVEPQLAFPGCGAGPKAPQRQPGSPASLPARVPDWSLASPPAGRQPSAGIPEAAGGLAVPRPGPNKKGGKLGSPSIAAVPHTLPKVQHAIRRFPQRTKKFEPDKFDMVPSPTAQHRGQLSRLINKIAEPVTKLISATFFISGQGYEGPSPHPLPVPPGPVPLPPPSPDRPHALPAIVPRRRGSNGNGDAPQSRSLPHPPNDASLSRRSKAYGRLKRQALPPPDSPVAGTRAAVQWGRRGELWEPLVDQPASIEEAWGEWVADFCERHIEALEWLQCVLGRTVATLPAGSSSQAVLGPILQDLEAQIRSLQPPSSPPHQVSVMDLHVSNTFS